MFLMSWVRTGIETFGKAPLMSRKSNTTSFFLLHACVVKSTKECTASVAVRPFLPPYWLDGSKFNSSTLYSQISLTHADRSLANTSNRAMGLYALGIE